jgi:stage II sporulation protein D
VIGSRGRTRVTGGQLRARFGLFDTWAFFTSITSGEEPPPDVPPAPGAPTGGVPAGSALYLAPHPAGTLAGRVLPVLEGGKVTVQARWGRSWVDDGEARVGKAGRYAYAVMSRGVYRVRYHDETGPAVRIR